MRIGTLLALLGLTFAASAANATITYSFSAIKLVDTYTPSTGPYVSASGSFEIAGARNAPLQDATADLLVPLDVDITITNNSGYSYSFTDPSMFLYADGSGVDGAYYVDLTTFNIPFLALTINRGSIEDVDFFDTTFNGGHGFTSEVFAPSPVIETISTPEVPAIFLTFPGLGAILAMARIGRIKSRLLSLPL